MNELARLPVRSRSRRLGPARARRPAGRQAHYYAFLSYSHRDEELADWLHRELEDFHVPAALAGKVTANGVVPRRLKPIFRDEQELAAADDLGDEIRAALAASQFLIVLCSPSAASSHWTNAEIETFKRTRPDGCILAAIAEGEPFASDIAGREREECFPPALRQKYDRRGRPTGKKAEPLAADLRGGPDDRRMGFLKLVAGMLGVGLDDLVQREATRRQRRMGWIAGSSLLGMLVAIGLAVTAIQARDAARDQRREAEGLVAFMLGDLKDKLEPIGKLDALDGVGQRVLAYYRDQDASQLSDAGLVQRSRALSLSAQVAYQRGQLTTAQKLYQEAMKGTQEAVRRSPSDPQRLYDHAQNVFYQAQIASDRGDLAAAGTLLRDYDSLAARMTALEPDNLKWRMEKQYAQANLGFLAHRQRRFDEAVSRFSDALATIEVVAGLDRNNAEYQLSTAETLAWLADAQLARGDVRTAINVRRRQVAVLRSLAAASGGVQVQQKLIPAQQSLGRMLAANGQLEAAKNSFVAAVDTAEQLLPNEPTNSVWIQSAALAHFALTQFWLDSRNLGEATASVARGCALAEMLAKLNPASLETRANQWSCSLYRAMLHLDQSRGGEAFGEAQQAVAIARAIESSDSAPKGYLLARSLEAAGNAAAQNGDRARAMGLWRDGLGALKGSPQLPWEVAVRADLMSHLGREREASALRAGLRLNGIERSIYLRI